MDRPQKSSSGFSGLPLSDNSASSLLAVLQCSKPLENKSRSKADPLEDSTSGCYIVFKDVTQKEPLHTFMIQYKTKASIYRRISVQSM